MKEYSKPTAEVTPVNEPEEPIAQDLSGDFMDNPGGGVF